MSKVNVGIVGLGLAGYELHAKAYAQIEDANVYAICSRDKGKAEEIRSELDVTKIYADYDSFLSDDGLDAVSICVPDPLHFEYASKAVEAGKHVMCEKPLATNIEDAKKLVALARGKETTFAVGHVYRFVPQFTMVKNMLASGRFGQLFHIDCDYQQDMRRLYQVTPWRRDDKSWNSWVAGGAHVVDLIRFVGGDVDEIMMYANKGEEDPHHGPVDDNHLSIMKFKNGATCKVWEVRCIKRAPEFTINLGVYGARGTSTATLLNNRVDVYSLEDGEMQADFGCLYSEEAPGIPIRKELEDFISSILNGHPPRCDVVSGAKTLATVLAAVDAQTTGRPVKVPDIESA